MTRGGTMVKFGIDIGHNCPPDTGAEGLRVEDSMTLDVGKRVMAKLRALGHEVIDCTPRKAPSVRESLRLRCEKANSNNVNVFVSIHFNSFDQPQANGAEVFAVSPKGRQIAGKVLTEIIKLGFFNRGVKSGSHLYVVNATNAPAILIEPCFVSSPKDMELYDAEKMACAIVAGLTA